MIHVNIEHDDRKSDVKRRVSNATGIPLPELKLLLVSPTQIGAGSKLCPGLAYGNCGVCERVGLAVVQAESGDDPFQPRLSPNRIDNTGIWTKVDKTKRKRRDAVTFSAFQKDERCNENAMSREHSTYS